MKLLSEEADLSLSPLALVRRAKTGAKVFVPEGQAVVSACCLGSEY